MDFKSSHSSEIFAVRLHFKGRVQGVGFRPFIFRLAIEHGLFGVVFNRTDGVIVHIEGEKNRCNSFVHETKETAPQASTIKEIIITEVNPENYTDFQIVGSEESEYIITEICPDIAICEDCIQELSSNNRRKDYPLINCTNCGPRFTLIQNFPYDRKYTSMHEFTMCPDCRNEYEDPLDRRFHAQPISCFACGPTYELHWQQKIYTDFKEIIRLIGTNINEGKVVAMKGLGGYNLACDATSKKAIKELRHFKKRERKPFAILFRSLTSLQKIVTISKEEEEALLSWRRPIVIVNKLKSNPFPEEITCGLKSLGAFLPYLPLHYLLFDEIKTDALVLTSGNESDVPILYQDDKALETFSGLSGGVLINNRKIARRADDSVVRVIEKEPRLMRRARGFVPSPIDLNFDIDDILATGAELSNAFCIGKHKQAIFSQHIGDLKNAETYEFFTENIEEFSRIYRFKPKQVVCDLHPDYLSTRYAKDTHLPITQVQHHHAHIASVMAEFGINEPVIGLAYDGTGYGPDNTIWGSELLLADFKGYKRLGHFEYIPLPGGDKVTKEPWRTGLSYLYKVFGENWTNLNIPFTQKIDLQKAKLLTEAIDKNINSPMSCSAGRLFDAVAAILNVCLETNYHAEAPQLLENYLIPDSDEKYSWSGTEIISFAPMFKEIIQDLKNKRPQNSIVTKFHNTIAYAALQQAMQAKAIHNIKKIVVSGGSFQNKYLTEKLVHLLLQKDFEVFFPREISCNDGGIALGQLAIAAHNG